MATTLDRIERARDSAVETMDLEDSIRRQPVGEYRGLLDLTRRPPEPLHIQYLPAGNNYVKTDEPQWTGWE